MSDSDAIAKQLSSLASQLKQIGNQSRFSDQHGWPALALSTADLAVLAENLAERAQGLSAGDLSDELHATFQRLTTSIEFARNQTVPNIFGNVSAPEAVLGLFYAVEAAILRASGDTDLKTVAGISLKLRNRASTANARLNEVVESVDGILVKLQAIEKAHDAAEDLPITQKMLSDAITAIEVQQKAIIRAEISAAESSAKVAEAEAKLVALAQSAEGYLENIKGAYRAVTSQGLAQAFGNRESALNQSMLIWVLGLISSLFIAGIVGQERFPQIVEAVKGTPNWGTVAINFALATLSLTPAVWFAWVATTQIGQRFRLAEDYAYKAAISAAYEGYRSEAENLDPLLQAQLFASALGRLDELPLRLIDAKVSGSPLQELLRSNEFKEASEAVPGLLGRVLMILRRSPAKRTPTNVSPIQKSDAENAA